MDWVGSHATKGGAGESEAGGADLLWPGDGASAGSRPDVCRRGPPPGADSRRLL